MADECCICTAKLVYLEDEELLECALCHTKEYSKTRCREGHYVCSACHMRGMDVILTTCHAIRSKAPIDILDTLMSMPFCHMHGPEHHTLVGAALVTATAQAGYELDLTSALTEMLRRGKEIPGGACGFWGACGSGISAGIAMALLTKSHPLTEKPLALANLTTSRALAQIAQIGGPRCCKRNAYLALAEATACIREHLGIALEEREIRCSRSIHNNQCIGQRCPFHSTR